MLDVLEIIANDLRQVPGRVDLSLEYVSTLPSEFYSCNSVTNNKFNNQEGYWVPWIEEFGAWVNRNGSSVVILIKEDAKEDIDARILTLGFTSVITGTCLNLQGQVAIHANAVSFEGKAVAFVGYSGMGKSTLSAYCASQGAGFITDDVLVVNEQGFAISGNPRIKLYPETGSSLGLDANLETDYKIFYEPSQLGASLHASPVPLEIIYLLESSLSDRIYSSQVPQLQGVFDLLTHGYDVSYFIPENPKLLHAYTRLVSQVPVKKLFYPRDLTLLPLVYKFLLEEVRICELLTSAGSTINDLR